MGDALRFLGLTLVYAGISGYGLFLMKSSAALIGSKFFIGLFFYGTGFLLWLWILRTFPLTIAFPAAAGTLIVATQVFGVWLDEAMTFWKAGALLLIMIGIVALSVEVKQ